MNGSYDSANVAADDFDNRVAAFANGADRTLNGDDIFDPTAPVGAWYVDQPNRPLFATSGPSGSDIFQGPISDCKVVSSLSAIAHNTPGGDAFPIRRAMADFGDGTFGVRLNGRFYRVDKGRSREVGGTGLGLSIVRQITEAHGGQVRVRSVPGEGSTFTVVLPVSGADSDAVADQRSVTPLPIPPDDAVIIPPSQQPLRPEGHWSSE